VRAAGSARAASRAAVASVLQSSTTMSSASPTRETTERYHSVDARLDVGSLVVRRHDDGQLDHGHAQRLGAFTMSGCLSVVSSAPNARRFTISTPCMKE
jgi:hypothetical protein